ncbi:HIT family protein [Bailinhaonella thermotolerans]|uniref:HIT family protein n=1 Tax=Bailinhaonella thermotolerans TaxID=1070861 RepID=A0A3A4A758_9ACTN|nr:HIT family protein [Bailinhaonella thermotolerans]RJL21743.1 HIT family protein [Bailinhaonella thermotolerans]
MNPADCLFCRIAAGEEDAFVVHADDTTVAFLDTRPVFKGHTLLIPRAHVETLPDLPPDLLAPLFTQARALAAAMERALSAGGSFVAMNNRVSQSVPHLHVHVVPRTKGDGLRGFFWPRVKYENPEEAASYASKLRQALP